MKTLSQLLEQIGYKNISPYTDKALDLHDYQCHGLDPDTELSKHRSRAEAVIDTIYIVTRLVELVEEKLKPRLEEGKTWTPEHTRALQHVKRKLAEKQH